MNTYLPKQPFNTLALSLSGGGYRAASFHLGLLTYLSSVEWNGQPVLNRARVISTVSGGTFTGACYASTLAQGHSLNDCYEKLYSFLSNIDLISEGLKKLSEYNDWKSDKGRSLINALSLVYFDHLEQNTFSLLFKKRTHLTEIIFNATEFTYGLPFRFQKCELKEEEYSYAFLGNRQVNMSPEAIKEVRLSDVIAASSCFPMGFEPINFPKDFRHEKSPILNGLKESWHTDQWGHMCKFPVGLMDGGIVDNQGIDSVIWAEKRMQEYKGELKELVSDDEKAIDLYIISDVASPFMDGYVRTEEKPMKGWRNLHFKRFMWYGLFFLAAGAAATYFGFRDAGRPWLYFIGAGATMLFLAGAASLLLSNLFRWLIRKFQVPEFFVKRIGQFSKLKFGIYETLIMNRINSVISMVSEVFMKQIRRQEYGRVYNEEGWETRLVMNAIYELTPQQTAYRNEQKKNILSKELQHLTKELMDTAEKAKSMGTTLWFTPEELKGEKDNMLKTLIAAGQFTACYNLLEYIEKVIKSPKYKKDYDNYSLELKKQIDDLYEKMLDNWKDFNKDPYWMVNSIHPKK
jgi:predicted acylesterase/phospholipase RssA